MKRGVRGILIGLGLIGTATAAGLAWRRYWHLLPSRPALQSLPIQKLALTPPAKRTHVIETAQRQLDALGYRVAPTGRMDAATKEAVSRFSVDHAERIRAAIRAHPQHQAILTAIDDAYRNRTEFRRLTSG